MKRIANPDLNANVKAILLYTKATGTIRLMPDSFMIQYSNKGSSELQDRPIDRLPSYLENTKLPETMKQEILSLVPEIKQENGRYVYQGDPKGAYSLGKKKEPVRAFKSGRSLVVKRRSSKAKKSKFGKKVPGKRTKAEPVNNELEASLLSALRIEQKLGSNAMKVVPGIPPEGMDFSPFFKPHVLHVSGSPDDGDELLEGLQGSSLDRTKKPSSDPSRDMEQGREQVASTQSKPSGAGMMKF